MVDMSFAEMQQTKCFDTRPVDRAGFLHLREQLTLCQMPQSEHASSECGSDTVMIPLYLSPPDIYATCVTDWP